MNQTIEQLLSHRSVRHFKKQALTDKQKQQLITAAQAGSSSNFLQAYTIIEIKDPELRRELGRLANCEDYVVNTGLFYVFVADLYRHATIAAQNMAIAAESMDLGICYIGGIRNDLDTVAKRLSLPELTVPLFGLTIGVPETLNGVKPRMPFENILSENHYQSDKLTDMHTYDELLKDYYASRSSNAQTADWSQKSLSYFSYNRRPEVKTFLQKQGFDI
ncbi:NADPH-dependent oxidoreductase [Enterococcus faecalis]|uniref:NADPH-dependent oxidoreductase n=1 Tax=Enterococcus faecalis TaxID=1351 RepID=UPI001E5F308F|nr:NADPH-dependent oxidoreductase [Enterococcus faecalis]MCD5248037.1 NADPH-dependent oxidoreductase [Enterococcus faecalis]